MAFSDFIYFTDWWECKGKSIFGNKKNYQKWQDATADICRRIYFPIWLDLICTPRI